jgi:hypothetical protein
MSLLQLLSPFYAKLPDDRYAREVVVGQLGWTVVPIPDPVPRVLDPERQDARVHNKITGEIRNMKKEDFARAEVLPVYRMQLRRNEACLVQRSKRRLAIVVSHFGSRFDDVERALRAAAKKHLQEQNIIIAPLYPHQTNEHPDGFLPVMRSRIEALMYSQFFPCARNDRPLVLESAARLDRLLPIVPQAPTWEPLPLALAPEALSVLLALLRLRFGSSKEQEIEDLRDLLRDAIPPEHQPTVAPRSGT